MPDVTTLSLTPGLTMHVVREQEHRLRITLPTTPEQTTLLITYQPTDQLTHEIVCTAEAGARGQIILVQNLSTQTTGTLSLSVHLEAGAEVTVHAFCLGGLAIEHDFHGFVEGSQAMCTFNITGQALAGQQPVINVANTFTATAGRGEIIERLVVSEGGFLRSRGGIEIGLRAGQTDTYLTQEVLLLGSKAKADVTPGLEIKTNDVKASHSASITRLSEDDLFMVGSRGLEPDQARQMLIDGFLWSLLERVPEGVREEVRGLNIVRNR